MPAARSVTVAPTRRRGITLSETLLTSAAVAILLAVIALGMDGIRTELKRAQAVRLMETLDQALLAYHAASGQWPADPAQGGDVPPDHPLSATAADRIESDPEVIDRLVGVMVKVPASRVLLDSLPDALRARPSRADSAAGEWGSVQDPWGRSLYCLTAVSPMPTHRKAVAANQNRPIFISAGPDGRFGFNNVSAASDNIRSDEIGR